MLDSGLTTLQCGATGSTLSGRPKMRESALIRMLLDEGPIRERPFGIRISPLFIIDTRTANGLIPSICSQAILLRDVALKPLIRHVNDELRSRTVYSIINRYYDPATDQFLSIDPDVATTDQPYVFTNDDPLNAEDPLGLCSGSKCSTTITVSGKKVPQQKPYQVTNVDNNANGTISVVGGSNIKVVVKDEGDGNDFFGVSPGNESVFVTANGASASRGLAWRRCRVQNSKYRRLDPVDRFLRRQYDSGRLRNYDQDIRRCE